ncbi:MULTISPECIES: AMP-binding protein [Sphingobium]|uniref:AMP-binding protein n=1 Tax=Sphingobium TaxID=165695 RepID=UPI00159C63C5|nr:AMP-binding protein [Sphingobium sp. 15-1]
MTQAGKTDRADNLAARSDGATMGCLICTSIARHGPRVALVDDRVSWTYDDLGRQIGKAMTVLRSNGLERGQGIAILSANRCELVAVEYAAMLLGLSYTALHPMAAQDTHEFILADSGVSMLLVDGGVLKWPLHGLRERIPSLRRIFALGAVDGAEDFVEAMAAATVAPLRDEAQAEDVVRLFYTGGTTGKPKGVMWPHRVMLAVTVLQGIDWELPPQPHFLAVTPVSHASGAVIPTVLSRGGSVRLTKGFGVESFCALISDEGIDCTFLVPTMIYVLLDHLARTGERLEGLGTIMYGAAPMSPDRLREGIERLGPIFCQLYGQTEAPMCITTLRKGDHDPDNARILASCGYPTPLVRIALLDEEGRPVEPGRPGELCVRGPLVSNGYWNRPDANEKSFAGGWLHTGDVAVQSPEGYYTIVDRTSDLIITGGFNVYPSEVEDVLNAHPAVALSAVIGVPDPKWGEAVTAFLVVKPSTSVDIEELRAGIRSARGAIWVPKEFHVVDEIPLTAIGKIDRKALGSLLPCSKDEMRGASGD